MFAPEKEIYETLNKFKSYFHIKVLLNLWKSAENFIIKKYQESPYWKQCGVSCLPRSTSNLFSSQSKGNCVDISNTDLTLWKQSEVIERGSDHCYLCLKKPSSWKGSVLWSHCDQGVAVMEYLICWSVWKTLILRCESDTLYPKIA